MFHDLATHQAASADLHHMADITRALMLAIELPQEADQELINGEKWSRRLLVRYWGMVLRLASRLVKRGTIEGAELQALFR